MEEELYNFVNGNWKQAHDYLDQDGYDSSGRQLRKSSRCQRVEDGGRLDQLDQSQGAESQ